MRRLGPLMVAALIGVWIAIVVWRNPPKPWEPQRVSLGRGCVIRGIAGTTDLEATCPDAGTIHITQRPQ